MTYQVALKAGRDVIHRYGGNPLITIEDLAFRCSDIWNAGVVRFRGEYLLLLTVETLEGLGSIFLARGTDGYHFSVESKRWIFSVLPLSKRVSKVTLLSGSFTFINRS